VSEITWSCDLLRYWLRSGTPSFAGDSEVAPFTGLAGFGVIQITISCAFAHLPRLTIL